MNYTKVLIGDTVKFTWVNSGVAMSPVVSVYTGSETLVDSGAMIDSLNGMYFFNHTVNSAGYYSMVAIGSLDGYPYKKILQIKAVTGGVD